MSSRHSYNHISPYIIIVVYATYLLMCQSSYRYLKCLKTLSLMTAGELSSGAVKCGCQFYAELPEPTQADLSLAIDALARRFNDHSLPETYRASLMTLRKQPKETLEEYVSRVHRTVAKTYPGIAGSKLVDDLTIENLVGGLPDSDLVYDVLTKKPHTVQVAINLTQSHESCKGVQRKKIGLKWVWKSLASVPRSLSPTCLKSMGSVSLQKNSWSNSGRTSRMIW